MTPIEELEWATREYTVASEHLLEVLNRCGDENIPPAIYTALMQLAHSITREWA